MRFIRPTSIIIGLLALGNAVTAGLLLFGKSRSPEVVNPYPLIDFARSFIPQKDFIVNIQPLREELNSLVAREGKDSISLYFEFLNTGANISINPNLSVYPASLIKLPVALAGSGAQSLILRSATYDSNAFSFTVQ